MTTYADNVLTLLRAAVPSGVSVFDSIVPGVAPARYVIPFIPDGLRSQSTVDAVSDHISLKFDVMTVTSTTSPVYAAAECRALSLVVRDTLTDAVISATGWGSAQIQHENSRPPVVDESTPDKKVYTVAQFSLQAYRTS